MSCGSCSSCRCNPCRCAEVCDPSHEPLASALNNFVTAFFGSVTKTCVNDQVVWSLPCDLDGGVTGFPRNSGEGIACYVLRYVQNALQCQDFRKIFIDGVCYDTWQAAYDAGIGSNVPTLMLVGNGDFGDLSLTADYNTNIVIFGLGDGSSRLGNVLTNQFNFVAEAHEVAINSIDTRVGGVGGATVTLSGAASIGTIANGRNDAGAGAIGTVTAEGWEIGVIDNSNPVGTLGGSVVLTKCTCGQITVSAVGSFPGSVTLRQCPSIGSIVNDGTGGTTTNFVISEETNIISGAGLPAISEIAGTSSFINSKIKTIDTNQNAIAEVTGDGAQFINTTIVPHGTGLPIEATVARTIIAYNFLTKNAPGANVNASEGTVTSSPNIRYP